MTATTPSARLVNHGDLLRVVGADIEALTPLAPAGDLPCVLRGTIPPGGCAPLHSHPDAETFVMVDGRLEGLTRYADGTAWVPLVPGDVFHVPGGVPHAFRNRTDESATALIVTTTRLERFFREVAPANGVPPTAEDVATFAETARRYGHWLATPEENAAIGLRV
jgi:uncharacterized RmlC-like cupin family protein